MQQSVTRSCLYFGHVIHRRLRPRRHHLCYRVFSLYVDVDELPALARTLPLFSYNRFNVFSFHDQDFGDGSSLPLRAWVERQLADAGIALGGGRIGLLCYPRLFGYAFNPLSVFFCYTADGMLTAILYEVHNTFKQKHTYLIRVTQGAGEIVRQRCEKAFYVSPFIPMAGSYDFRVRPAGETVLIAITESDPEGPLLHALFTGERRALTTGRLTATLFTHPLMTLKVIAGIHWEALRLWLKRIPLVTRPAPPTVALSVVGSGAVSSATEGRTNAPVPAQPGAA
jgi:hypothetical protein